MSDLGQPARPVLSFQILHEIIMLAKFQHVLISLARVLHDGFETNASHSELSNPSLATPVSCMKISGKI